MPEQHKQIFTSLGLSAEDIDAIEALTPETLKDFKSDDYLGKIRTGIRTQLTNDPDFLESIPEDKIPAATKKKFESGQYARFQNELMDVAKTRLGLGDEDLTAEDRKSIKGLAEKMATSYLSKKGNVEGMKDIQAQLSKALQDKEALSTQAEERLKTELEAVNGKYSGKIIKTLAKVELQGLDLDLKVGANYISDPILAKLNAKYSIVLDENTDELTLKQKANPALDVIDTAGKTVTFKQALRAEALASELATEKKPGDTTRTKSKVDLGGEGGEGGSNVVPEYIRKKAGL